MGTPVADVCASRVGLLLVVACASARADVVAGAVVAVVVRGISACLNLVFVLVLSPSTTCITQSVILTWPGIAGTRRWHREVPSCFW